MSSAKGSERVELFSFENATDGTSKQPRNDSRPCTLESLAIRTIRTSQATDCLLKERTNQSDDCHNTPSTLPLVADAEGELKDEGPGHFKERESQSEPESVTHQCPESTSSGRSSHCSETGSQPTFTSPVLDTHRRQAVELLMKEFNERLLNPDLFFCNQPFADESFVASSPPPLVTFGQRASEGGRDGEGQRDDSTRSEGAGGEVNPVANVRAAVSPISKPDLRLSCPFFKRDPRKHTKHRSCAGPGWPTVHRIKYVHCKTLSVR